MAEVERFEVAANGLSFETLAAGPAGGEPVLLLHGYPQSAHAWDATLTWLAAHGYRGIAPNLRGYSPGANPQDAAAYTMDQLVADVIGIADAQGATRFHLVGHDWGGALAWAVAARHPERLLSLTSVSTPHPAALVAAMRSSTQLLRSSYMALFRVPRIPETLLSLRDFAQMGLAVRINGLPAEAWQRHRAQLRRVGLRGPLNWYRSAAAQPRRQRRITVPTLYIWGRRDTFLGRRAAELTEQHVSGPYRFVELDAGHWIPERDAAEMHELLAEHLLANRAPRPAATRAKRTRAVTGKATAPRKGRSRADAG